MRKLIVLATVLMVAAPITSADAAKKAKVKTVNTSGTALANQYTATGTDKVAHYAGLVTDKVLGKGALIFDFKSDGSGSISGPYTVYTAKGSISGIATYTIAAATDGSGKLNVDGGLTVTKATGAYKLKGTGKGTLKGTQDPTTGDANLSYTLSYKLKK
jgi:hypothetical protein